MKKRTTLLTLTALFVLLSTVAFSQTNIPNLMHFTAVARDASNDPIANDTVNVKIEIFQGDVSLGDVIYCEQTENPTNSFGEFSMDFPKANGLLLCDPFGQLSAISWESGDKWVQVSVQDLVGSTFSVIASFPFTTVPFAFASRTAESLTNFDLTGAANGQVIKYNATTQKWEAEDDETSLTSNVTYTQAPVSGDGSQGNPVTIGQNNAISGQVLKWNGSNWAPANDIGGVSYSAGPGIDINVGNVISAEDASNTNEIQTLNFNPSTNQLTISGSGGNTVQLNGGNPNVDITGINGIDVTENPANSNNFTITTDAIRPNTQAGGDITGTYQNLQIGFAAVGSDEIGNNAIGNNEMANDAVGSNEIINGSITGIDLDDMGATQGHALVYSNGQWGPGNVSAPVPEIYIFEEQYNHGEFPKVANTNQPPVSDAFNTRNINTQVYPASGGPSNVILGGSGLLTFKPGTYLIDASAPAFYVYRHQLFLRRVDNTIELNGTGEYARQNDLTGSNATGADQTRSFVKGVLVVPPGSDRIVKLDHYLQATITGASSLGVDSNQTGAIWNAIKEVYATITIQKVQ